MEFLRDTTATADKGESNLSAAAMAALFHDEGDLHNVHNQRLHNYSVTDICIGNNGMMDVGAKALVALVKANGVLRRLQLNVVPEIPVEDLFKIFKAIRLYNSALEDFSIAETSLSVKTVEAYLRIAESDTLFLERIDLHNCKLKHLHIQPMPDYLLGCSALRYLDLHQNNLGEKGAVILSTVIAGRDEDDDEKKETSELTQPVVPDDIRDRMENAENPKAAEVEKEKKKKLPPPLTHIDLSSCNLGSKGAAIIANAISKSSRLIKYLNLSENNIGSDNNDFFSSISLCQITELRLTNCSLQSKGGALLLQVLAELGSNSSNRFSNRLAQSLRSLRIAENKIADSAAPSLCQLLENNMVLQLLDLGFNLLSNQIAERVRAAAAVNSESSMAKKVMSLTVNLIGNPCDPYLLDTPGMSRSKSAFQFGIKPSHIHPEAGGYGHLADRARNQYLIRKEIHDNFTSNISTIPIHSLF